MIEEQPLFTSVNEFLAGLFVLLAFGGMAWLCLRSAMRAGD
jgi:hypothetical protein